LPRAEKDLLTNVVAKTAFFKFFFWLIRLIPLNILQPVFSRPDFIDTKVISPPSTGLPDGIRIFIPKNPHFYVFLKVWEWKLFECLWPFGIFMAIWYFYGHLVFLWPFGICYGHLVYFGMLFTVLIC
jgi:hypothetical protein